LAGALGVLSAVVPAAAIGNLLGCFAGQALSVENLTAGAAKLVGFLAVEASEEKLTIGGVGIDGMFLEESIGSDFAGSGAGEPFDGLEFSGVRSVAPLSLLGLLLVPDTASDGGVEDERSCTRHLEGCSVVAGVELGADVGIFVVEDAVGARALRVDSGLRFLLELAIFAVDVVGEDALLAVPDGVVKQKTVRTEVGLGDVVLADVVEIALFRICKESVLLRTGERERGSGEVLSESDGREEKCGQNVSEHCEQLGSTDRKIF